MRRLSILVLAVLAALVAAVPASAAPGDPFQYKGSFAEGTFSEPTSIEVSYQTGNVLVFDSGTIYQFNSAGEPTNFTGTGEPTITGLPFQGELAVDHSGGATQGNIYLLGGDSAYYWAYSAAGTPLPGSPYAPPYEYPEWTGNGQCGGTVAANGNLWYGLPYPTGAPAAVREIAPNGKPTGKEAILPRGYGSVVCRIEVDSHGDIYVDQFFVNEAETEFRIEAIRLNAEDDFASEGPVGFVTRPGAYTRQWAIDPSTDQLFSAVDDQIVSFPYTKPLVSHEPEVQIGGLRGATALAFDPTGQTLYVPEQTDTGFKINIWHREPPVAPHGFSPLEAEEIRSQSAVFHSTQSSGGAPYTYWLEYGPTDSYGSSTAPLQAPFSHFARRVKAVLTGLQPGTDYHVRLVAKNAAGTSYGPDKTITTYPTPAGGPDPCPNALARQQTGARTLPDCRAFELVSAPDTGGYDVESSVVPGQQPYPGFPDATDKVLYSTHAGAIPGPWNPTNKGPDPYLATRSESGWVTSYLGLPADLNPEAGSFASQLGEASTRLDSLAFAGADLCSPCFDNGLETGIPVRRADGSLVQGMAGSLDSGVPADARPEGRVAKYFSDDGNHLVFASKYAFEPGANEGGDLTVYERDLQAGSTEIVSTDDSGATLTGAGISELDIDEDGSRVVVGKRIATDAEGNEYVHPYLHLAGTAASVDLAPGTTSGVLYAGMTRDGARLFLTTVDQLLPGDTDASADLYEAAVDAGGNLQLSLVTPDNSDACDPVENEDRAHWNSVGGADCGVVAISGGGGVSAASGTVWFLSPEQLDGSEGALDQPNLYRADPGEAPVFVATLEPDAPVVLDSVAAAATRRTADFQTTPDGGFAAFASDEDLGGFETFGFADVFRYDAAADAIGCASCDRSGSDDHSYLADSFMAPNGLSLLADGRVFFTTKTPLVLNDPNQRTDVYSWSGDKPQLISGGTGPFDSALLSVSADGTDAFFFTHDTLAPEEDHVGPLMKIYDARVNGGFFKLPAEVPCAASDECHGPSSPTPPAPNIKSSGPTTRGNVLTCRKGKVKRHGKCVRKKKRHHKKKKHHKTNHRGEGERHA
ncbi:MAG TPA: fibronectin type III domain-containing protein [Solirubrobacterales bacterium]|jgi:hypothetical protein|nr:fibronectin type III domain-containing protein [Solirubrobacterales bacterium]